MIDDFDAFFAVFRDKLLLPEFDFLEGLVVVGAVEKEKVHVGGLVLGLLIIGGIGSAWQTKFLFGIGLFQIIALKS